MKTDFLYYATDSECPTLDAFLLYSEVKWQHFYCSLMCDVCQVLDVMLKSSNAHSPVPKCLTAEMSLTAYTTNTLLSRGEAVIDRVYHQIFAQDVHVKMTEM